MNRLFTGIATIALVGVVVAGATVAFYNDTETSTGNVFTAGSIDLKVDHTLATYNNFVCQDGAWVDPGDSLVWQEVWQIGDVDAPMDNPYDEFNYSGPVSSSAIGTPYTSPFVVGTTPDTEWPWNSNYNKSYATDLDVQFTYSGMIPVTARLVVGWSPGKSAEEIKEFRVDYDATPIGTVTRVGSTDSNFWSGYPRYEETIPFVITNGTHTLNFLHTQGDGTLWDYVRLEILPGSVGTCNLFEEQNLSGESFFTFGDVKPGDEGTNVISLHVETNDAYACLITHDGVDNENYAYDPEIEDGDNSADGPGEGELQDYLEVFVWQDLVGDGVYDVGTDTYVGTTTIDGLGTLATYAGANGHLTATTTAYVGLAWCAGDISVDGTTGDIDCDGNGMPNKAQSDSYAVSLTAYAEQVRNNTDFQCSPNLLVDETSG